MNENTEYKKEDFINKQKEQQVNLFNKFNLNNKIACLKEVDDELATDLFNQLDSNNKIEIIKNDSLSKIEKNKYFLLLTDTERKELFDRLIDEEKKQLLSILEEDQIKSIFKLLNLEELAKLAEHTLEESKIKMIFQTLDSDKKKDLLTKLPIDKQKEYIKELPEEKQKQVLREYNPKDLLTFLKNNDNRMDFLPMLLPSQLQYLYNKSEEKENVKEALETAHSNYEAKINEQIDTIEKSNTNIATADEKIAEARATIKDSNIKIIKGKIEHVKKKIVLRKLTHDEEVLKEKIRHIKAKGQSKIRIIEALRLKRIERLEEKLKDKEYDATAVDERIKEIDKEIETAKNTIKQANYTIESSKIEKKEAQEQIKNSEKEIKRTQKRMKRLEKTERKIFGRKKYEQILAERANKITTAKSETVEKITEQAPKNDLEQKKAAPTPTAEQTNTQKQDAVQTQNDDKINNHVQSNSKDSPENSTDVLQQLFSNNDMQFVQPPDNIQINPNTKSEPLYENVNTQFYIEMLKNNRALMDMITKLIEQNNEIINNMEHGRSRTKTQETQAAFINFTTIVFIISGLITIISIILLMNR